MRDEILIKNNRMRSFRVGVRCLQDVTFFGLLDKKWNHETRVDLYMFFLFRRIPLEYK